MLDQMKDIVCREIDWKASDLNDISHRIWENPELGYEEFAAHELLTTFLEKEGFNVLKKTPLETSFIARYGNSEGLKIGILCEYDALPGVGHACGHNLIAEAGIGAALGLKAVFSLKSDVPFEIIVYGTPAEEIGSGKVQLIEAGVFDDVDFCMMSHPAKYEIPQPKWIAIHAFTVVFTGKASHAAAAPWEGINALDAAVACYNNASMLRQQMKPSSFINVTIPNGGDKPNIIPRESSIMFYIRGVTDKDMFELEEKVFLCAEGAATSTGCSIKILKDNFHNSTVKSNPILTDLYVLNAKYLGVQFNDDEYITKVLASTDMGNVSQIKPSIHPLFKIQSTGSNHTHDFQKAAGDVINQLPTLNSAKSMAMTAIDVICKPELMQDINKCFKDVV